MLLLCTRFGVVQEVYCAGNDQTLAFVQNVLEEVLEIFPSVYIHVGGDECPKDRWQACPKCQARIRALGLKDEHELQSWFVRQMDAFLQARGRRLVGWDEILEGGLAPGAGGMSWRGEDGGIAAAKGGHDVIMAPCQKVYFDHYQSADQAKEPLAIGGCCTLENAYGYEPVPAALTTDEARHVLGAQGQLWSEYLDTWRQVEYMAFPRAAALAEVLWSPAAGRDYADFRAYFMVGVPRTGLGEFGFAYDAHPLGFYDIAPLADYYDGSPAGEGAFNQGLWNDVTARKAGGVGFDFYVR